MEGNRQRSPLKKPPGIGKPPSLSSAATTQKYGNALATARAAIAAYVERGATPAAAQPGTRPAPGQPAAPRASLANLTMGPASRARGSLTSYQGYRFDSNVLPYIQRLMSAVPGLRVTSGYRDPAHNRRVGGARRSYHLQGRAIDLVGSPAAMQQGARWARQNGAREVLIHRVHGGVHLHAAW